MSRPSAHDRGYNAKWQRTRARKLRQDPLCECDDCLKLEPHLRPVADVVDHIDNLGPLGPRGHDLTNLRSMAKAHHDRKTASRAPRKHPGEPHPGLTTHD